MNRNLFEVGEVVILQSVDQPNFNGEYVVEGIIPAKSLAVCRLTSQIIRNASNEYGYFLNTSMLKLGKDFEAIWQQSALRKKYKGSDMRYNEMIKSLNVDIVEVV